MNTPLPSSNTLFTHLLAVGSGTIVGFLTDKVGLDKGTSMAIATATAAFASSVASTLVHYAQQKMVSL